MADKADKRGYVWVVMQNESPKRVFVNAEKANAYMEYHQKQEEKSQRPWAFWRSYHLKVER